MAALAIQRFKNAGLLHHSAGQGRIEWRQGQCAILEDLYQQAPGAKQQYGAKLRIERSAENQFVALLHGEGLNRYTLEVSGAGLGFDRFTNLIEGAAHSGGIGDVENDSAYAGFVDDGEGVELEDDRVSDGGCGRDGGFFCLGDFGRNDGNAVGLEQLLRFVLGKDGAAAAAHRVENFRGAGAVGMKRGVGRRRLIKAAKVVGVAPQVVEGARGSIGVVEAWNSGTVQNILAGVNRFTTHPGGQQGLSESASIGFNLLGDARWIGHSLRRHDHQQSIDIGIFCDDLQRSGIAFGIGIADDIHRIVVAPCSREGWR